MRNRSKKNPAPGARSAAGTGGSGAGTPLEQRLAELISSEREGLENLQRLQEQRRMAQKDDDTRRLEALEQAAPDSAMTATATATLRRALNKRIALDLLRKQPSARSGFRPTIRSRRERNTAAWGGQLVCAWSGPSDSVDTGCGGGR